MVEPSPEKAVVWVLVLLVDVVRFLLEAVLFLLEELPPEEVELFLLEELPPEEGEPVVFYRYRSRSRCFKFRFF